MKIKSVVIIPVLASLGAAPTLVGCQSLTGTSTAPALTQVQTDANLLDAGIAAVAATVETSPTISPSDLATIKNDVAELNAANAVIQGASTGSAFTSAQTIQAVVAGLGEIVLSIVAPGSDEAIAIQAAENLLPILMAAMGQPAPAVARVTTPAMAVEARLVLRGYAARHGK